MIAALVALPVAGSSIKLRSSRVTAMATASAPRPFRSRRDRDFEAGLLQRGVCKMEPNAWAQANCRPALREETAKRLGIFRLLY